MLPKAPGKAAVGRAEEVEALKNADAMEVLLYVPRRQGDFPTGAKAATVRWIGKDRDARP
jgi:hypothetical protein